ncbi:MAG: hypothetical protein FRX49_05941 [Trebouxia sp. A1-2]|nr:MAG: hypothetical protein FRX49_05941 [Trebouxia sp. A1-2]
MAAPITTPGAPSTPPVPSLTPFEGLLAAKYLNKDRHHKEEELHSRHASLIEPLAVNFSRQTKIRAQHQKCSVEKLVKSRASKYIHKSTLPTTRLIKASVKYRKSSSNKYVVGVHGKKQKQTLAGLAQASLKGCPKRQVAVVTGKGNRGLTLGALEILR